MLSQMAACEKVQNADSRLLRRSRLSAFHLVLKQNVRKAVSLPDGGAVTGAIYRILIPFATKRDGTVRFKLCRTLSLFASLPSAMTESVMLAFKMNDSNGDDTELYSAGAAVPTNASISCSYLERSSGTPSIGGIKINPSRFTKNVVGSKEIYSFSSISSKGRRLR